MTTQVQQEMHASASIGPQQLAQPLTLGTAVASTSGTSIDFSSIPSWVKRVTVMFNGSSFVVSRCHLDCGFRSIQSRQVPIAGLLQVVVGLLQVVVELLQAGDLLRSRSQ